MAGLTEREIWQQPEAWDWVLEHAPARIEALKETLKGSEYVFCGCGSAYHVGLCCAAAFRACGLQARAETSSEAYLFSDPSRPWKGRVMVAISRSGETSETVMALRQAVAQGARGIAVTCDSKSALARAAPASLILDPLNEQSVITTKSVTGMIAAALLAAHMLGGSSSPNAAQVSKLPECGRDVLKRAEGVCQRSWDGRAIRQCAFLGSGPLWGVANEARLKMQEMALVPSGAFAALEFRHGPMAQCGPDVMVVAMLSGAAFELEVDLLRHLAGLGTRIVAICEEASPELNQATEFIVEQKSGLPCYVRQVLYLPVAHLLALRAALSRGVDPDSPPHLVRSVILG